MTLADNRYMFTTSIPVSKTLAQISQVLVQAGARHISQSYGPEGEIAGLCFMLPVDGDAVYFKLPARAELLFQRINGQRPYAIPA